MSRYIDADALKEQMLKYGFHSADQTVTEFVEDTLPTADVVPMEFHEKCMELEIKKRANMVERKRGEWIEMDGICNGTTMLTIKCSVCNGNAGIDENGFWFKSRYCPNCGADMRGEND